MEMLAYGAVTAFPTGTVEWSGMGTALVWLGMAFIGSVLGLVILGLVRQHSDVAESSSADLADTGLKHAA
jgi:hypothetical protein